MTVSELQSWMKDEFKEVKDHVKTTNGRVRSLEKWRWTMVGAMGVIIFIITLMGKFLLSSPRNFISYF